MFIWNVLVRILISIVVVLINEEDIIGNYWMFIDVWIMVYLGRCVKMWLCLETIDKMLYVVVIIIYIL